MGYGKRRRTYQTQMPSYAPCAGTHSSCTFEHWSHADVRVNHVVGECLERCYGEGFEGV